MLLHRASGVQLLDRLGCEARLASYCACGLAWCTSPPDHTNDSLLSSISSTLQCAGRLEPCCACRWPR